MLATAAPVSVVTFPAGPLLAALRRLCAIVEKRNSIPIRETVLVAPQLDGSATLATTGMDMWWRETAPADTLRDACAPFAWISKPFACDAAHNVRHREGFEL